MFVWYTFISNHLKIGCLKILQLRKKKAFKKVVLKSAILICHFKWEYIDPQYPFFIFHQS